MLKLFQKEQFKKLAKTTDLINKIANKITKVSKKLPRIL